MAFTRQFLFEDELPTYGLPSIDEQPDVMNLVQGASLLIDEHCGQIDTDGNGSLVYSEYSQRLLMPRDRNVIRLAYKPLSAVTETTRAALAALGDNYYTGFRACNVVMADGTTVSPLISISGRYGYGRRGDSRSFVDAGYGAALIVAANFGGPPSWLPIDTSHVDFDVRTGEIWVPAGLYPSQYTEITVDYVSGFDPRNLPHTLKFACSALVKNLLVRARGTTGIRSLSSAARITTAFTDELIDPTIDKLLTPFKTVLAD